MNNENSGNPTLRWIFWILAFIVLIIAINLGIKSYKENHPKKVFPPKKYLVQVSVEVRRKSINLTPNFNNTDSIHIEYGQYAEFKFASVAFCVKNNAGEIVCGPAYSDPDLPSGESNMDLWFKSEDGESGHLVVVIFERREQLVQ